MVRSFVSAAACGAALALVAAAAATAAPPPPAVLDPAFGDGGLTEITSSTELAAMDLAETPDGGVVAVGFARAGGVHWVTKLDADGTPDRGFGGGDGSTLVRFDEAPAGAAWDDAATRVRVDRSGRIVLVGSWGPATQSRLSVARLLPDGSLDASFDGDGRKLLLLDAGARYSHAQALHVAVDGSITIAGGWQEQDSMSRPPFRSLVTLGPDGTVTLPPHALFRISLANVAAIAVAPDGRVAVAGDALTRSLLSVRTAAPAPAPGFPDPFLADLSEEREEQNGFSGVTFTPDGGIVATGFTTETTPEWRRVGLVASFAADGGGPRVRRIPAPDDPDLFLDQVTAVDGKLLATGAVGIGMTHQRPAIVALGDDGLPDPSRGGVQSIALPPSLTRHYTGASTFTAGGDVFMLIGAPRDDGWSQLIARIEVDGRGREGEGPGREPPGREPPGREPPGREPPGREPPLPPPHDPPHHAPPGTASPPQRSAPPPAGAPLPVPPPRASSPRPAARAAFRAPARGPVRSLRGSVAERTAAVEVALVREADGGRCRALTGSAPRFARPGSCRATRWLSASADGRGGWRLALARPLPSGRYRAWVRAAPLPGRSALPFSAAARNRIAFAVPAR